MLIIASPGREARAVGYPYCMATAWHVQRRCGGDREVYIRDDHQCCAGSQGDGWLWGDLQLPQRRCKATVRS